MEEPECNQAKSWQSPDGPVAQEQVSWLRGRIGQLASGSSQREKHRERPGAGQWHCSGSGGWRPGVQTWDIGPPTVNSGGNVRAQSLLEAFSS